MKCPSCDDEWLANYCPVCKRTICNPDDPSGQNDQNGSSVFSSNAQKSLSLSYRLTHLETNISDPNKGAIRSATKKNILIGSIWLISGILITLLSIFYFTSGGHYLYITWGAIVYGIIRILKGIKLADRSL